MYEWKRYPSVYCIFVILPAKTDNTPVGQNAISCFTRKKNKCTPGTRYIPFPIVESTAVGTHSNTRRKRKDISYESGFVINRCHFHQAGQRYNTFRIHTGNQKQKTRTAQHGAATSAWQNARHQHVPRPGKNRSLRANKTSTLPPFPPPPSLPPTLYSPFSLHSPAPHSSLPVFSCAKRHHAQQERNGD